MADGILIADDAALRDALERWPAAGAAALDTEFIRERTYFPQLCLVQLATPAEILLIDVLALRDPQPLVALLQDRARTKLLHAARQDLEALLPLTGEPLAPLLDTQVAAALVGFAAQVGYAELVRQLLGVELAKGHARTDWARRPLSAAQLAYAADDVRYLADVAAELEARLDATGRRAWAAEDSAALADPALYRPEPEQAWRRLRGLERLAPPERAALKALAAWRERRAVERDLPRGWVLPDTALREIARRRPADAAALTGLGLLPERAQHRLAPEILEALQRAGTAGDDDPDDGDGGRPSPEELQRQKRLQQRLGDIASGLGIQPEVLATRRELAALARGARELPLLRGWRREVVGEPLLAAL